MKELEKKYINNFENNVKREEKERFFGLINKERYQISSEEGKFLKVVYHGITDKVAANSCGNICSNAYNVLRNFKKIFLQNAEKPELEIDYEALTKFELIEKYGEGLELDMKMTKEILIKKIKDGKN